MGYYERFTVLDILCQAWLERGRTEKVVYLPAPALFNFDNMQGWLLMEEEFDTYVAKLSQQAENVGEDVEDDSVQPSNLGESSYQQPSYDWGASSSSSQAPDYDHSYDDPQAWSYYPRYWAPLRPKA